MSNYKSFILDFPVRCQELLFALDGTAKGTEYHVTSAITFATAAIVIPFERLRYRPHPSGDAVKHAEVKRAFDVLMTAAFLGSSLFPHASSHTWCFGRLSTVIGTPDEWPELQNPTPLLAGVKVRCIITHLRNALSHGNIFTQGDPISRIIFLSETDYRSGQFNYLVASPSDFREFLRNWFAAVKAEVFPAGPVPNTPEVVAVTADDEKV